VTAPIAVLITGTGHDLLELARELRNFGYVVQSHARLDEAIRVWARGACKAAVVSISSALRSEQQSAVAALREQCPDATIMVLSASGQAGEREAAINAGADDYLAQPFSVTAIHERLSSILQYRASWSPTELHLGPLVMKAGELEATIGIERISLTPNECGLLELFALAAKHMVGRNAIAHRFGKGGQGISAAAVHLLVHRLRRRLLPFGFSISTLRGAGYRLNPPGVGNGEPTEVLLAVDPPKLQTSGWDTRLLEYMNDAIIIWEMQGRGILFWNPAAEKLYGYTKSEALGRTTHRLLRTQLHGGIAHLESSLARYGAWIGELTHTTSRGKRVRVEARLALMSQANGRWLVLEVNRDVTDLAALDSSRRFMDRLLSDLHDLNPK
jgi:PAS domain S-box-containing protein